MIYVIIIILILFVLVEIRGTLKTKYLRRELKNTKARLEEVNRILDLDYVTKRERLHKTYITAKLVCAKIQKNYAVRQQDKLILIDLYYNIVNNTNQPDLIYQVKTNRKFTYKVATNIILDYMDCKDGDTEEVINAITYLIMRPAN